MFKKLTDYSYQRNWKEAIGFYLSYLLLSFLSVFVLGMIYSLCGGEKTNIPNLAILLSVFFCLVFSFVILKQKKMFKIVYIILVLLSPILALFGGVMLGLLIPAFLTTRKK